MRWVGDITRVAVTVGQHGPLLTPVLQASARDAEVVASPTDAPVIDAEVIVTLLHDEARAELAAALTPTVKWVHVFAAGVDGFPFELLGDRVLTCSRGASAAAIAEFALAAMLAFEKQVPEVWIEEPPEQWGQASLGGLNGRTLALAGLGAIGTEVARRALAFGMEVVAVRRTSAPATVDGIEVTGSLIDALARADHVVVAAAATDATRHLLDAAAFAALKPGAHFVNVARGSLVDHHALLAALDGGRVARASLDVTDPEPLPAGHALYLHPKVRVTPHISWSSPDTVRRTIEIFVENLARWRRGNELAGRVDPSVGY
jgi:phosphoglycerate dehydrogenase-like enzyme